MTNKIGRLIEDNPTCTQRDQLKNNCRIKFKPDEVPDRFELFLLEEGESKVESKEETQVPNTSVFTFNKEDHTLANMLSQRLLKYDHVTFSAYKVPHPLFATFELRVSTDGSMTPKDAVVKCCTDIIKDLDVLNRSFQTEWLGKRIVSEGDAERAARERDF
ncbi:RBP11-like subunits of RNA polymerase [Massarina eburnea CBS 473.64]|uniref:RBP11-like subunits of RNA polymerase n=1 Tax=Massarina eburnea CBS 473.64 TaxID=1395130 RepID=A0A6A6SG69_9PLEO|nr:RBP11-like subunits of RNA polymerase [Massarina eburnea CBS 473.64]